MALLPMIAGPIVGTLAGTVAGSLAGGLCCAPLVLIAPYAGRRHRPGSGPGDRMRIGVSAAYRIPDTPP